MALPQTPPGGSGRSPRVHFTYVSPKNGKNFHAWMAGMAHWYECHTRGKSCVCLNWISGGELECPRCVEPVETQGYVPLYRETDTKPVMVIVKEYAREIIDRLCLHQWVVVGRGLESSDGVYVVRSPAATQPKFETTLAYKKVSADLTETLLRVWRSAELIEWYRQTHGGPAIVVPPKEEKPKEKPKRSDGKPFSPMTEAAANRHTPPAGDSGLDDVMERLKQRGAALPSTNGKH